MPDDDLVHHRCSPEPVTNHLLLLTVYSSLSPLSPVPVLSPAAPVSSPRRGEV